MFVKMAIVGVWRGAVLELFPNIGSSPLSKEFTYEQLTILKQGSLSEGKGSVQLTSLS
jgi:hypothetical protein